MAAGVGTTVFDDDLAADGFGNDQVDDLFGDDDDLFNAPAPLPPLSPPRDDGGNDLDGAGEGEGQDGKDEKKKKRIIKRSPRPRLNEARLCGERGITALAHLCDGVKFKGKGHEASDLKVLLQRFEHWAHRLYPLYPFEDVVEQVEALGKKKLVQNAIKQARRGDDGQVNENPSDDDDEMQVNGQDSERNITSTPSMDNADFGGHVEASSAPVIGLTPEQKERIRLNRERALAKRRSQSSQPASSTTPVASQDNPNIVNQLDSLAEESQDKMEEAENNQVGRSPERSKLDFDSDLDDTGKELLKQTDVGETMETEMISDNDILETKAERDKETMATEVTGDKETMAADDTGDKETMATEVTGDKETMATEVTGDKESMATEVTGDKETMETEVTGDKETMATDDTGDKETMATDVTGDKKTMATDDTGDKETMATDDMGNKETMTTDDTGDKETVATDDTGDNGTMATDVTGDKETMITEVTGDKETMITEVTGDKEAMATENAQDNETMKTVEKETAAT